MKVIYFEFGINVFSNNIPLLSAFDKAEANGEAVLAATDERGRADPRRMTGWSAYCSITNQIQCLISKHSSVTNKTNSLFPMSA